MRSAPASQVTDDVRQPAGLVHGGVYAAMAESICSAATWLAVQGDGMAAMGQSNSATFLRPITEGHVNAVARPRHRGRTTLGLGRRDHRRRGRLVRPDPDDRRRPTAPGDDYRRKRFVIGRRRSRPNAFGVMRIPGGAWRRLYSERSTIAITSSTRSARDAVGRRSRRGRWSSST